ncbi:hypothetical protein L6452_45201 [Arctium lappa]|nr:hypothetical protein L6452_45201 [Arctium lappa]
MLLEISYSISPNSFKLNKDPFNNSRITNPASKLFTHPCAKFIVFFDFARSSSNLSVLRSERLRVIYTKIP